MQDKKRLSINIIAQIVSFAVQFGLNFFLTPFVVSKLGTEAYGFIGLSNTLISYAQVLTVALNSMAGRFIAIEFHKGNTKGANRFFTSVFYANVVMSVLLGMLSIGCVLYLEYLIHIPSNLVVDVKLLFSLLVCNFLISIIFSVYNVATFIKNRLDYVAVRSIVSNIIRACLLLFLFSLFAPMLWYIGLGSVVCTIYISLVNIRYKRLLTPELGINYTSFNVKDIKTVTKAGVWNSISRLSNIIEQGFDLLLANLFISAFAMGQLAITKQIPVIVLTFMHLIGSAFAPSLTQSYARESVNDMKKELVLSVKLMGFFAIIPLCFIFGFMDVFYELWLPGQNYKELYILTTISCSFFPILLSLEGVQNLWPILNRVKGYSMASIIMSCCTFILLLSGLFFIPDCYRIYYLVSVSAFNNILFTLLFIPIYASKCLNVNKTFFYPTIAKVLLAVFIVVIISLCIKMNIYIHSWGMLILCGFIQTLLCVVIGVFFIWNKGERFSLITLIRSRLINK